MFATLSTSQSWKTGSAFVKLTTTNSPERNANVGGFEADVSGHDVDLRGARIDSPVGCHDPAGDREGRDSHADQVPGAADNAERATP